jgi:formate C-acetyltransferase
MEEGKISREYAKELLQELYIKLNELIGRASEDSDAKRILQVNSLHYMIIAGTDYAGSEVTNDVSFLMLEAIEELDMCKQPTLVVRWFPGIDKDFMKLAVRLVSNGRGFPTFVDERKTYEALVWYGVDEKEAHDFVFYGCNNICMPGNSDQLMEIWHNGGKYMELALNEGRCLFTDKQYGAKTKPVDRLRDMEDIWDALREQIRHCLMAGRQDLWSWDQVWARLRPFSFESVIDTHCIERAVSLHEGGGDFKHYNNHFAGMATVANSLYAIKKLVFDDKQMTLGELVDILRNNWEGQELLRARVVNKFEKYGNDRKEVDEIAVRLCGMFVEEVAALPDLPNGRKAYADIYSLYHPACSVRTLPPRRMEGWRTSSCPRAYPVHTARKKTA